MKHYSLLFFLFFLMVNKSVFANSFLDQHGVSHITIDDGLPNDNVTALAKDDLGFLWIATDAAGLSRYDGYSFLHFNTNSRYNSIKSNFINSLCLDDFGRLWIASDGGIDILNLRTNTIISDVFQCHNFSLDGYASTIYSDSKGKIWTHINDTLFAYGFDGSGNMIYKKTIGVFHSNILAMEDVEEDGSVWFYDGETFNCVVLDEVNNRLEKVAHELTFLDETQVTKIIKKEFEIWIGTNNGLYRYDLNRKTVKNYLYNASDLNSISHNFITDIAIDVNKHLIVSTLRGINVFNPMLDNFERITHSTSENSFDKINCDFINCILADNDKLWLGTTTGGLNKIFSKKIKIEHFTHNDKDPHSLSPNPVNSIYIDEEENLWVGTVEGGLNFMKKGKNKFYHYTMKSKNLSHNSVSALTSDSLGNLWIGTWGGGVSLMDKKTHKVIRHINFSTTSYSLDFVGILIYDWINEGVWIGANQGLFYCDLASSKVYPILPENQKIINGYVGGVIDSNGKLWIGGINGMFVINLHSFNVEEKDKIDFNHFIYKLDKPQSKILEKITSVTETKDGVIWIGSNGNGLYKCKTEENGELTFLSYTTDQGLVSNTIRNIIEGNNGLLWVTTNKGLSIIDTKTDETVNYTKKEGLLSNQFYWNAACKNENKIYLGTTSGLAVIDMDKIKGFDEKKRVVFTGFFVEEKSVLAGSRFLKNDISYSNEVFLHERDKSFQIDFSTLDFESQNNSLYEYRLLGFDDKWITLSSDRRFAAYTNLNQGQYLFQVRSISKKDDINTPVSELKINIKPYFYKTGWFLFLLFTLVALFIWTFIKVRVRSYVKAQNKLKLKVEERTLELKQQKETLEIQTKELSVQNKILKQQNEKIKQQKEKMELMSSHIQKLTSDKLTFFTNITHELRTPITLISGPVEKALRLSKNDEVVEQLQFAKRNARYLLTLVNQLMDFRKIENKQLTLNKQWINYGALITSVLFSFEESAKDKNITIKNLIRLETDTFSFDENEMKKVFINLLGNAIKFTPDNGVITMYSTIIKRKEKKELYFSISDTGFGLDDNELPYIFDRFYQSNTLKQNHLSEGTGIGLFLCKQIIQMHEGVIEAKKNHSGQGATFRFTIPLHFNDLEHLKSVYSSTVDDYLSNEKGTDEDQPIIFDGKNILIVEDNKDMRLYIGTILRANYNLFYAENGLDALNLLKKEDIDLIISDLMMPVMDGIEFSENVKKDFQISHIPILMLTAKKSNQSKIDSFKIGVDDYILKPFDEELLLARIENVIENQKRYKKRFIYDMNVDNIPIEEDSQDKLLLDTIMKIVKENYKNSYFDVGDFSEAVGVSKSLLNKKLQGLTGQTPGQFMRNYRLNVARDLILKNKETQQYNISEIAYEVGFNDPKYFTRCFSKHFNIAPSKLMGD